MANVRRLSILNCKQKDALNLALETYGDSWRAYRCVYEISYYEENGSLPPDAIVIERVDVVGDEVIFIHADPFVNRQ